MWKDIKDFEGIYQVNDKGEVKCLITGRGRGPIGSLLKPQKNTKQYLQVVLRNKEKVRIVRIHRLVAEHFIDNPDNLPQVDHIDNDKTNNNIANLQWCSNQHNCEKAMAKSYLVIDPDGFLVEIYNLNKWLNDNPEIQKRSFINMIYKKRPSYKGWRLP